MKKIILVNAILFLSFSITAQELDSIKTLIAQGVTLHDKGEYNEAIAIYEQVLVLDPNNVIALSEKAFSLLSIREYEASIETCREAIKKNPKSESLKFVYTTYANAFDESKYPEKAIEIYNQGIVIFPDYYQLHFNKGITLSQLQKYDEAILSFQHSVMLNPQHASSHNAIGRLLIIKNDDIPSLLALCRFLVIEPQSTRAKSNLPFVQKIMSANVEKTGRKSITINIDPEKLPDTENSGKTENDFSSIYLILSLSAALDFDKKNKKKTEVELFQGKFETICSSLKETQKGNFGFYWEYYVPYFIAMKEKNLIKTFSYLVYTSSENPKVEKWLNKNQIEVDEFYNWSSKFQWNMN